MACLAPAPERAHRDRNGIGERRGGNAQRFLEAIEAADRQPIFLEEANQLVETTGLDAERVVGARLVASGRRVAGALGRSVLLIFECFGLGGRRRHKR